MTSTKANQPSDLQLETEIRLHELKLNGLDWRGLLADVRATVAEEQQGDQNDGIVLEGVRLPVGPLRQALQLTPELLAERLRYREEFRSRVEVVKELLAAFGKAHPEVQEIWLESNAATRSVGIYVQCWEMSKIGDVTDQLHKGDLPALIVRHGAIDSHQLIIGCVDNGHHYDGFLNWSGPSTQLVYRHPDTNSLHDDSVR